MISIQILKYIWPSNTVIPVISMIITTASMIITTATIPVSGTIVQNNICEPFSEAFNETVHKELNDLRGKARCRLELVRSCGHSNALSMETVDHRFGADCVEIKFTFGAVVNPRRSLFATHSTCVGRSLCAGRPREKLQSVLRMAVEVEFYWKLRTAGMEVEVTGIAAESESLEGMAADIALRLDESGSGYELAVENERVLGVVWMGDGRRSFGTEFMDINIAFVASVSSPSSIFFASMAGEEIWQRNKG